MNGRKAAVVVLVFLVLVGWGIIDGTKPLIETDITKPLLAD